MFVSLAANGTIVAIEAPEAGVKLRTGQVKVYRIDSAESSWEQLGDTIYDDFDGNLFEASVDISDEGNTIAVGSLRYSRVFSMNDSDDIGTGNWKWKQIGQDIDRYYWEYGDKFWSAVSLSGDGKTLAVGAYGDYDVRAYRLKDSKSDWMQLGKDFDGDVLFNYEHSAHSVSLSEDGNTVAIGSAHYNYPNNVNWYNAGRVRIFVAK
jgi:hypothetical protein